MCKSPSTKPVRSARTPAPWVAHRTLDDSLHFTPTAGCQQSAATARPGPFPIADTERPEARIQRPSSATRRVKIGKPLGAVGGPWTACRARRPLARPGLDLAPGGFLRFLAGSWSRTEARKLLTGLRPALSCGLLRRIESPPASFNRSLQDRHRRLLSGFDQRELFLEPILELLAQRAAFFLGGKAIEP